MLPTAHSERHQLSMCLDVPRSSSPFPSPSSSFLPPPTPGNHEFAMCLPPPGHPMSKASVAADVSSMVTGNGNLSGKEEVKMPMVAEAASELTFKDPSSAMFDSQATLILPSAILASQTPTPTFQQPPIDTNPPTPPPATPLAPPSVTPIASSIKIPSPLPSPSTISSQNNPLTPNRPAPPSPTASRRVSSMSTFSTRSPAPTTSNNVSRANSIQRASRISSNAGAHQFVTASAAVVVQVQNSTPRILIHVRDFAFEQVDERFRGAGALVPRANHLAVLHRKLAGLLDDDDDEMSESETDGEDLNTAWDKLRGGWSVNGWGTQGNSPMEEGPSQEEMELNFGGAIGDGFEDFEDEVEVGEEPLYAGLYRAMYAFEPEGTAEMALVEDQVVRVVGRGGGIGWAVVVDESAGLNEDGEPRHALVPESYLEVVRLDWEEEEEAAELAPA
ncbi:hypothetical protein C0989_000740 [Termitomyces sp. Mn162]|nr:hypothetical protein C0989_000740 [Termitomyces sp. Mn162]